MFKIFVDDILIYDSTLEDYIITKGQITKEINKSGSFVFTIHNTHPYYDRIQKMKSIITVYKGEELVFRGRVINEVIGFYKDKTFTCEGELGFLLDSIIRPYDFTGTPEALLRQFIDTHNSQVDDVKKFVVGTITVTDPNDYIPRSNSDYDTTSSNLQSRLLDPLGGYLFVSGDANGNRVIDWYAESPYQSGQTIEFGENLLDFTRTERANDIATAIIPIGAEIEDETTGVRTRVTITDINDGLDYIYDSDAVSVYGWIFKIATWDDVTLASNLKKKAEAYLRDTIKQSTTIELSAVDLSLLDKTIDSFRIGDRIRIISKPHNLDDYYFLEKQTIDLLKPDNDQVTLGYTYTSFTDASLSKNSKNETLVKTVEKIEGNYVTNAVVASELERLQSLISQTESDISMTVSTGYVTNEDLTEEISTLYKQLDDSFTYMFTQLSTTVNDNDETTRTEFTEIKKYIRFEDGNIILGKSGNQLTLKIQNDRISFLQNSVEVAYFSNKKLYVTDGEFLSSLTIGNFAFTPRDNGNLSFKKVR